MNLTVERATRLACSEEVASEIPFMAQNFERCAQIKRDAFKRSRQMGGCRSGCMRDKGALDSVGEIVLRYLATAPEDQVAAIKTRLGADKISFSVDGVRHER